MEPVPTETDQTADTAAPIDESDSDNPPSTSLESTQPESKPELNRTDILKALEVVERDSVAIAESFSSLFSSLRLALSEVTTSSVDHMQCFNDAAGRLQESVLEAANKGNRYINSCLRLNQEMKGIESLATQFVFPRLHSSLSPSHEGRASDGAPFVLRRNVDALDTAVNRIVRLP